MIDLSRIDTYEPKAVTPPVTINEKPSCSASSSVKASSVASGGVYVAMSDLQEVKDAVPDLITPSSQVEHPEYLPAPLATSRLLLEISSRMKLMPQARKALLSGDLSPESSCREAVFCPDPLLRSRTWWLQTLAVGT